MSVLLSVRPSRGCLGLHISASREQGRPQRCMLIEWTFQEQVRKTGKVRRWAAAAEQSVSHMLRAEKDGELHRIWATRVRASGKVAGGTCSAYTLLIGCGPRSASAGKPRGDTRHVCSTVTA